MDIDVDIENGPDMVVIGTIGGVFKSESKISKAKEDSSLEVGDDDVKTFVAIDKGPGA